MGEDDFKVRCVRDSSDENAISKTMLEANKRLKAEGFSPVWFSSEDCAKIKKKEKNCVYLFDPFGGKAFDHIQSLGCRILGPQCILESLEYKLEIPRKSRPVYNLAMRNVVACCTNLDKKTRDEVHEKIELMSGCVGKDFTDAVTHLVAGEVGSKKYQVAASLGKKIMSADWVFKVWEISQTRSVHGNDGPLLEYRCPIFKGLVVTVSGLDPEERSEVKKLVNAEGGKYSGEMKVNECTHLIINKPKGTKYEFAKKWKLNIVKCEWLYDSIEKGFCQEPDKYGLEEVSSDRSQAKTSTPEKDIPHARISTIADLSCISNVSIIAHVNETAATTHKTFEDTDTTLNGIDLTQPPADLFLDGCKVYLSGFRGQALEKVRKIINAGGGTRLNQLNENVTHVIIGEQVEKDIELLNSATIRPHVVGVTWLAECYRQGHAVDEQPYLCQDLITDVTVSPKPIGKSSATDNQTAIAMENKQRSENNDIDMEDKDNDMEDIMSQYLLQGQGQNNTGTGSQDATVMEQKPEVSNREQFVSGITNAAGGASNENKMDTIEQEKSREKSTMGQADVTEDPGLGDGPMPIFQDKTFILLGFDEDPVKELTEFIVERKGVVLDLQSRLVPDYAVVPLDGFPVDRTVADVVTNVWLQMCIEQDTFLDDNNELYSPLDIQLDKQPLSDCVLSVSGYSGTEKDCLMHIAEVLGARCQDYFLRKRAKGLEPNTHLIVREAEGTKYQAAKKWNIPAVSSRWLLACAKSGQRESEQRFLIELENKMDSSKIDQNLPQTNNLTEKEVSEREHLMEKEMRTKVEQSGENSKDSCVQESVDQNGRKRSLKRSSSALDCKDVETDESRPSKVARQMATVEDCDKKGMAHQDSQKENRTNLCVNNRVQVLKSEVDTTPQGSSKQRTALYTPSPGRFLNPSKDFHPVFDLTEAYTALNTPGGQRKSGRRKSSLPLEDIFTKHMEEAVKITEAAEAIPASSSEEIVEEQTGPLHNVIIFVSKKLLAQQAEFHDTVSELGGEYRWTYDSSSTHYIFQGRANDTTKEFRLARDQGKLVVSPYWLQMCKEQNAKVDEALFPHTYNPNLSLSVVSSKRSNTPSRASRRSVRGGNKVSKSDEQESLPTKSSVSEEHHTEDTTKEPVEETSVTDSVLTKAGEQGETGGTLEMGQVLSKQLEKMMESKSKKNSRRKSKRLNSSGQMNMSGETSGDVSSNGPSSNSSRPPSRQTRWSLQEEQEGQSERRNSRPTSNAVKLDSHSGPEASQSVQITWDDPTGRLEEEKLAHKLERACSPTQDPDLPSGYLDAEFSDVEEEEEEGQLAAKCGKESEHLPDDERIKTPEPPALAFPRPKHSTKTQDSKQIMETESREEQDKIKKSTPVFLLSGISQEERDDFGALVEQLGGRMLDGQQYSSTCTHLVIGVPSRNEKFLASVASGKWVLHKSYFEACRQEGRFVQEDLYEWGGEGTSRLAKNQQVIKLAAAAHSWRVIVDGEKQRNSSCQGAFSGWKVLLCGDPNKEPSFRRLLEAGGASVLANKPPFSRNLTATHAFVDLAKFKMSQEDLEILLNCDVLCLRPDFIAAHLTDSPPPNPDDFCPPEISALKVSLTEEKGQRRKMSTSSSESRSKRSKKH